MSDDNKTSFFRQSGWMMIATFAMGVLMWLIHPLSKFLPPGEYGVVVTLFRFLGFIVIPTLGLQTVFARQAAASVTPEDERRLAGTVRAVLGAVVVLWLALVAVVAANQASLCASWKITRPLALWVTLFAGLAYLCWPIFIGVIQGRQKFFWYGWAAILNGFTRVGVAAFAVFVLGAWATGIVTGAWLGLTASALLAAWHCRDLFYLAPERVAWRQLLGEIIPFTAAIGAIQVLLQADMIIVQSRFPAHSTDGYGAASTLAQALVTFTTPIAAVMFPILVRNRALSRSSGVLGISLISTAAVAGSGALAVSLLSGWVIKFGFNPKFAVIAPIVPWFMWAMMPLALTTLLVLNLVGKGCLRAIPWLVAIAIGYVATLWWTVPVVAPGTATHPVFLQVIQTLGLFNLLALALTGGFSWALERGAGCQPAPPTV